MTGPARLTPFNGRVAHASLAGEVEAGRFTEGVPRRVAVPVADLVDAAGHRQRQLLYGDGVLLLEAHGETGFVWSLKDGYAGKVPLAALGEPLAPSHWVVAPATHALDAPDIKARERLRLSFGARLVARVDGVWAETDAGFVPTVHLRPIGTRLSDPVAVAERFLGTPYLWGGNTRDGIDCSGLVQAALMACGVACPPDSDLQIVLGDEANGAHRRGDLIFWKGHVAMAVDGARLIHANAHHMAVAYEGIDDAIARIAGQGGGAVIARRRHRGGSGGGGSGGGGLRT